jgi:4-amino-4-deoxy-L-arabinose transferase-like glycosyltransferase
LSRRADRLALLLLGLCLFAAGLGLRDPWPADEPRFALIARDMVLSGEWLIPRVGGQLYPDKPPLFMWLVAGFYWLTGNLRIAFLLPSLLAGLGTLVLVHDLARRLWGREAALLAGLLLLLTVQFTLQARSAQIDALVTFWITLGVYGLLRHFLLGPHWGWYIAAWVAMGLGIITKGVGFLPLLMFLPWALLRRRWPQSLARIDTARGRWWSGPPAMLLAVALWLVPMLVYVSASGSPELAAYRDEILLRQTSERYFDAWHHHQPFWFYLEVIPWAWLPLSLALPWLLPAWWRRLRMGDAATWLLLGWAACVLIFFTLSPGKRHVYLLPALPAVVLAAAPHLSALLQRRAVQRLAWLAVAGFAAAATVALPWASSLAGSLDFDPTAIVAAVALLAWVLAALGAKLGGAAALALLIFACWQIFGWWATPLLDPARSGAQLMARVAQALPPGTELGMAGWKEQLLLHADRPVVHFGFRRAAAAETRDAAAWLGAAPGRRLLIPVRQMAPCLDAAAAEPMGYRHRTEWRLAGREALSGACNFEAPAQVRYYDPWSGRLLPHVQRASPGKFDGAGELDLLRRDALGREVAAPRALGVAVLPPLVVRLAVGGEGLLATLVGFLESDRVSQAQIHLRGAQQQIEAGARLCAHLLAASALRQGGGVLARQPVEEHRPLLVGEQADEGQLGAGSAGQHHGAVAGED